MHSSIDDLPRPIQQWVGGTSRDNQLWFIVSRTKGIYRVHEDFPELLGMEWGGLVGTDINRLVLDDHRYHRELMASIYMGPDGNVDAVTPLYITFAHTNRIIQVETKLDVYKYGDLILCVLLEETYVRRPCKLSKLPVVHWFVTVLAPTLTIATLVLELMILTHTYIRQPEEINNGKEPTERGTSTVPGDRRTVSTPGRIDSAGNSQQGAGDSATTSTERTTGPSIPEADRSTAAASTSLRGIQTGSSK